MAAGKYYRDFNDSRETNTYQIFGLEKIHLVSGYQGVEGLYGNDIAVIILNNYIEFRVNVAPICIRDYKFEEKPVPAGIVGRVAGWGLIQSGGDPSETLKAIDLAIVRREECLKGIEYDLH